MITQKLGKYEILAYLGGGRFGDVYLAKDTLLDAEVALKVARTRISETSSFLHEIKVLFSLEHPNILRYYSADVIEGKLILITEHIDGQTLRQLIQKKAPLKLEDAEPILRAIASALDHAHSKNIIHRDLKPENIMIDTDERVKLMDFGLAKFLDRDLTESIGGTPPYMAPEAWRGHFYKATDQWALAVIGVEILAGSNPFFANNLDQIRAKIMEGFGSGDFVMSLLPKNAVTAISIALSHDAEQRFDSCTAFVEKLFKSQPSKRHIRSQQKSYDSVIVPQVSPFDIYPLRHFSLTQEQKNAISSPETKVLILGGAGTGKTHALIAKIHDLVFSRIVNPMNILVATLSVRGWQDLEDRLQKYLKKKTKDLWIGNFHRHCFQFVSAHPQRLGLKDGIEVIPPSFAHQRLRELETETNFEGYLPPSEIQEIISKFKKRLLSPKDIAPGDSTDAYLKSIWQKYQDSLLKDNLLDYDDVVVNAYKLLKNQADIRRTYQELFSQILIDDFQDFASDKLFIEIIKLLQGEKTRLFCTGDDDQNIYGWKNSRGVSPSKMDKIFEKFAVFNLTQSFRLPQEILSPALNLIQTNKDRIAKVIWSQKEPEKGAFSIQSYATPTDEASSIAQIIKNAAIFEREKWKDFAVLCRFKRNLRLFQEVFVRMNIPFSYVENESFFEKEDIALLIQYLRTVAFPKLKEDTASVIKRSSLSEAEAEEFLNEVQRRKDNLTTLTTLRLGIDKFGLFKKKGEDDEAKNSRGQEEINSFLDLAEDFEESSQDKTPGAFLRYLHIYKDSGLKKEEEAVKLLTIHQAKGIEFPVVFLTGLVEGEFPFTQSLLSESALEEERRLCYVGMTRATERLYLTYSTHRTSFKSQPNRPSRFLREMIGA